MSLLMVRLPTSGDWRYVTSFSTCSIYSTNAIEYTEENIKGVRYAIGALSDADDIKLDTLAVLLFREV